ncbi:MAG: glycosyltransferase [Marinobacter sp.]|uniref:glycosyltransferase n=1 Tax=Marinobacter sp. TaxID=50741 RepID=UPI0032986E7D
MRLLVLASTYPRWLNDHEPGFVHELAKRMIGDFKVTVLCPHSPGAEASEIMDGVEVVRFRYAPEKFELLVNDGGIVNNLIARPWLWCILPLFFLCQLWALIRINRSLKPDVVHAHWIIPQGLTIALARVLGARLPPYLLTSHGGDLFAFRSGFFKRLKLFAVSKASVLTVVSETMRKTAVDMGVAREKVRVRSMGVDLQDRFVPLRAAELEPALSVLFVGRLVEKKGGDVLIKSMSGVREAFPDVRLDLVGFGPEEDSLRKLADAMNVSDCIRFHGARSQQEVVWFYQNASVLAAPFVRAASGDEDGLGLVLAEALASGCPVVTTNLPATLDIVEGLTSAKVVVSGCPDALAESLIEVLRNQSEYRNKVMRERPIIMNRLDWQSVAGDYSDILKLLASRSPS